MFAYTKPKSELSMSFVPYCVMWNILLQTLIMNWFVSVPLVLHAVEESTDKTGVYKMKNKIKGSCIET